MLNVTGSDGPYSLTRALVLRPKEKTIGKTGNRLEVSNTRQEVVNRGGTSLRRFTLIIIPKDTLGTHCVRGVVIWENLIILGYPWLLKTHSGRQLWKQEGGNV